MHYECSHVSTDVQYDELRMAPIGIGLRGVALGVTVIVVVLVCHDG
jgi:hypothetical protein